MTINIITLGCSKNNVDSEVIAAQFEKQGHEVKYESTENTDIVVINTCCFIHDAKEQSIDEILVQVERKKRGFVRKVFVIGCLAQRYKNDLPNLIPEVDGYYAFSELNELLQTNTFNLLMQTERKLLPQIHYAYLKISEGCDRECSYCAIPLIRGKQVSKPIEMLIDEAKALANNGIKELILIAQDLTYYGIDLYGKRDLERLLRRLATINGIEWIRLHYAYPINFPFEILDVMREYSVFCKYLDIPLQHVNEEVLKSMRRGGNAMQYARLIERIRNKVPGIAIRTTLISGYPNETKEAHQELVQFVKEMRFERLGVFAYSQEEDTPAFSLDDPIRKSLKNKRVKEIMLLQEQISLELNNAKIGSVLQVIIDNETPDFYVGRTEFDSPDVDNTVLIKKVKKLTIGNFYPIQINKADYYDLFGIPV